MCGATHDGSWIASYIVLTELKKVINKRYVFLFKIALSVAIRVLMEHATACAAEGNWSAWKRFCMAERAGMTPEHFKQCMMVAKLYNGR